MKYFHVMDFPFCILEDNPLLQVTTGPTGVGGGSGGRGREHQAGGGTEPEGPEEADGELAGWEDVCA